MKKIIAVLAASAALVLALSACGSASEDAVSAPPAKEAPAETSAPAEPAAEVGTRENPAPLGTIVEGREYSTVINSAQFGWGSGAAPGNQYVLVNLTVTYTGTDSGTPLFAGISYVTPDGVGIDKAAIMTSTVPEQLDYFATLYTGAAVTGNIVLEVPEGELGTFALNPGLFGDPTFIAAQ